MSLLCRLIWRRSVANSTQLLCFVSGFFFFFLHWWEIAGNKLHFFFTCWVYCYCLTPAGRSVAAKPTVPPPPFAVSVSPGGRVFFFLVVLFFFFPPRGGLWGAQKPAPPPPPPLSRCRCHRECDWFFCRKRPVHGPVVHRCD